MVADSSERCLQCGSRELIMELRCGDPQDGVVKPGELYPLGSFVVCPRCHYEWREDEEPEYRWLGPRVCPMCGSDEIDGKLRHGERRACRRCGYEWRAGESRFVADSVLVWPSGASWNAYHAGASIGSKGSEEGEIIRDDEHVLGARITLERGPIRGSDLYAITCGVYGDLVHTAFERASTDEEAVAWFERMREDLDALVRVIRESLDDDAVFEAIEAFVESW